MPAIEPPGAATRRSLLAMLTRRSLNFMGLLCCAGLLGYAWYAQGALRVEPCPLCIFQRIGVAAMGVLFLLTWVDGWKGLGGGV
jgi:disulfide bond formation protein DsbB